MKLIINFSARPDGNCGDIARYIMGADDCVVHYAAINAQPCRACAYECFGGACPYRDDGVYALYDSMAVCERVVLVVPMYCGNPAAQYFAFCERGQGFFCTEESWNEVLRKLYIIGVYGSAEETPDFVPCLEKWFADTEDQGRVLGLERHRYGQRMEDRLLDVPEVREKLNMFMKQNTGG